MMAAAEAIAAAADLWPIAAVSRAVVAVVAGNVAGKGLLVGAGAVRRMATHRLPMQG